MEDFCGSVRTICRGLNREHEEEEVEEDEVDIIIPSTPGGGVRAAPL
jgi:hypothetical protein